MTIVNLTGRHQFQWNVNQNKDFLNSRANGIAICHVVAIHFITLSDVDRKYRRRLSGRGVTR